jgi:hypothetical protein
MMKQITILLLSTSTTLCLLCGSSPGQQSPPNSQRLPTQNNTLIIYLSRTNNTKAIAEIIHQKIGGRLIALELQTPYPSQLQSLVNR